MCLHLIKNKILKNFSLIICVGIIILTIIMHKKNIHKNTEFNFNNIKKYISIDMKKQYSQEYQVKVISNKRLKKNLLQINVNDQKRNINYLITYEKNINSINDSNFSFINGQIYNLELNLKPIENFSQDFDYKNYLLQKNIYFQTYLTYKDIKKPQNFLISDTDFFSQIFSKIKRNLISTIDQNFSQNASGLILGLFLGDTSNFDTEMEDNFKKIGITHAVAVSGANFVFIISIIEKIFKKFISNIKVLRPMLIIFIFIYMYLVGFDNLPAFRAFIFVTLNILLKIKGRKISKMNFIVLAITIIQIFIPHAYTDIGLQLSLLAYFMMNIFLSPLSKKLDQLPSLLRDEVVMSFFGSLILFPISLIYFQEINIFSTVANMLLIPLFSFVNLIFLPVILLLKIKFFLINQIIYIFDLFINQIFGLIRKLAEIEVVVKNSTIWGQILIILLFILIIKKIYITYEFYKEDKKLQEYYC